MAIAAHTRVKTQKQLQIVKIMKMVRFIVLLLMYLRQATGTVTGNSQAHMSQSSTTLTFDCGRVS